jgi:hypothetical protein
VSFWNSLFGGKKVSKEDEKSESPFMPEKKDPVEISFANNFISKGGRFLFSESELDCKKFFNNTLKENNWNKSDLFSLDQKITGTFNLEADLNTSSISDKKVAFISCEFLIANTGGILISSNQIKNLKLIQLPEHIIVKAKTNQFASDVSEGMSKLKAFYSKNIPTNITTLNAKNSDKESDFLSHGNSSKNIYLLLEE